MMKRGVFLFALISSFFWFTQAGAASDWVEYRSENVLLYSNGDSELSRTLVADLEVFREYLIKLTNIDAGYIKTKKSIGADPPFLVFALKNGAYFKSVVGALKLSETVAHPRGQVTYINLEAHPDPYEGKRGIPGRQPLFYEYVKYFLTQYSDFNYPLWYTHGLAMYLSTFEVKDGKAQVGLAPLRTVRFLSGAISHHLIPVEYVLGSTREYVEGISGLGEFIEWNEIQHNSGNLEFENNQFKIDHDHSGVLNPETQKLIFKNQAWGYLHYLQSTLENRKALVEYLRKVAGGEDFEAAFEDSFGMSLKEFHNTVYDYTERKLFPSYEIDFDETYENVRVSETVLDAGEGKFAEIKAKAFLLGQKKRLFAIKNQLDDVGGINRAEAETIIAEIDFFTGNLSAAKEQVGRVLSLDPDFGRAQGLLGAILVEEGDIEGARTALRRAIRADQNDLVALRYLGRSYLFGGGSVEEGSNVLARYVALNPADEAARLDLAALDARVGLVAEARLELRDLSDWGSNESIRDAAQACLAAIEGGRVCNPLGLDLVKTAEALK